MSALFRANFGLIRFPGVSLSYTNFFETAYDYLRIREDVQITDYIGLCLLRV